MSQSTVYYNMHLVLKMKYKGRFQSLNTCELYTYLTYVNVIKVFRIERVNLTFDSNKLKEILNVDFELSKLFSKTN